MQLYRSSRDEIVVIDGNYHERNNNTYSTTEESAEPATYKPYRHRDDDDTSDMQIICRSIYWATINADIENIIKNYPLYLDFWET